jgi:hypothetical protein
MITIIESSPTSVGFSPNTESIPTTTRLRRESDTPLPDMSRRSGSMVATPSPSAKPPRLRRKIIAAVRLGYVVQK